MPDLEITGGRCATCIPTADGLLVAGGFVGGRLGHPSLFRLLPDATVDPRSRRPRSGRVRPTGHHRPRRGRRRAHRHRRQLRHHRRAGPTAWPSWARTVASTPTSWTLPSTPAGSRVVVQPDQRVLVAGSFSPGGRHCAPRHRPARARRQRGSDADRPPPQWRRDGPGPAARRLDPRRRRRRRWSRAARPGRHPALRHQRAASRVARPVVRHRRCGAGAVRGLRYAMDIALLRVAVTVGSATGRGGRLSVVRLDAQRSRSGLRRGMAGCRPTSPRGTTSPKRSRLRADGRSSPPAWPGAGNRSWPWPASCRAGPWTVLRR